MLKNVLQAFQGQSVMKLTTWIVLTSAYTVIGLFLLIYQNLDHAIQSWGQVVQAHVYLKDDVTKSDVSGVEAAIKSLPKLNGVKYIDQDTALSQFKARMGSYMPDVIFDKNLGNPLPSSFEITFESSFAPNEIQPFLQGIAAQMGSVFGVDEISYGQDWVAGYSVFVKAFMVLSLILMFVLGSGAVLVVGNSIRSSVHQRRHEIEVLELLGATPGFIKRPLLIEGLIWGFLASTSAILVCLFVYKAQGVILEKLVGSWSFAFAPQFFSPYYLFLVVLMGPIIGTLGSYWSVREISSGWAAAQRNSA